MRFAGTKRQVYDKECVKRMRKLRSTYKPKRNGVSDGMYQLALGDLMAAGHLKLHGTIKYERRLLHDGDIAASYENKLTFISHINKDLNGEAPHVTGYLQSAFDADKHTYRLKGWLNADNTIRIEIVKSILP
jgi:hypothetical protein